LPLCSPCLCAGFPFHTLLLALAVFPLRNHAYP
jgi:hypothetical protein